MTNLEILELNDTLNKHLEELNKLKGATFAWTLNKNIKAIQKESKSIYKVQRVTEEYSKFEQDRVLICEAFSTKDESGKPNLVIVDGKQQYDLDPNNEDFKTQMQALRDLNIGVIAEQKQIYDDFNKLLKEENKNLELKTIALEDVPKEINVELMNIIDVFIRPVKA